MSTSDKLVGSGIALVTLAGLVVSVPVGLAVLGLALLAAGIRLAIVTSREA